MDQNDGKLIRINDPSEIKVGMAVILRSCFRCGKDHTFNIVEIKGVLQEYNCIHILHKAVKTIPDGCKGKYNDLSYLLVTFDHAIPEGRLFAIVDESPSFEETTVVKTNKLTKPKQLDKVTK